jgi:hypothetical protein
MPSTQKVLSLAAEMKTLEKDKEYLRINLNRAEEEVRRVVFSLPKCVYALDSMFPKY